MSPRVTILLLISLTFFTGCTEGSSKTTVRHHAHFDLSQVYSAGDKAQKYTDCFRSAFLFLDFDGSCSFAVEEIDDSGSWHCASTQGTYLAETVSVGNHIVASWSTGQSSMFEWASYSESATASVNYLFEEKDYFLLKTKEVLPLVFVYTYRAK